MNVYKEKLNEGMEFKGYTELSLFLGEDRKTGDSRESQYKLWDRHFLRIKNGRKVIIGKVFDIPLEKISNNKGGNNKVEYIEIIENLLLDILANDDEETIFLSKNNMLKALKMVSDNYTYGKRYPNRASKELEVDRVVLDDFYNISDRMLERNLQQAIKSLESQSLITCKMVTTVGLVKSQATYNENNYVRGNMYKETDNYGDELEVFEFKQVNVSRVHRKANNAEEKFILKTEREALLSFGVSSKSKLFSIGKSYDFYRVVNNILFEKYGIYVYYKSYEITFNSEHVLDECNKRNMTLKDIPKIEYRVRLNDNIVDRLSENTKKRSSKSIDMYSDTGKDIYRIRSSSSYVDNNILLIENFVKLAKGEAFGFDYDD